MSAKKKNTNGRIDTTSLVDLINKKAGETLAYDLTKDNPTEVKQWIPTGSTWLNKIICVGNPNGGVPVSKITELAGLEGSGKSYMAAQIAANAQKMRIINGMNSRPLEPLANNQCTLLALNQLKTNITTDRSSLLTEPYVTPGGKALPYSYSLRIWLTVRKAKASYVVDEHGYKIGSEVKARIKKSRFGSLGRECTFKILWGNNVGIQDEESWFDAIQPSDNLERNGAWYTLMHADGTSEKFQFTKWHEKIKDEKFRARVLEIMNDVVVQSWGPSKGKAVSS